jgi:ubiquinone/menaquinone biosynthesis C-methylase UbiE
MKLNWAERWVVNNPLRVMEQRFQIGWMKSKMPLSPGAVVLEVGSGRGAGAGLILEEFQPAVLHVTDLDVDMIRKAGRYLKPRQKSRMSMYAADLTHLPCRDQSVDAVFGFGVLHHVPDWRGAVREIARVLRVGGVYYLEEIYPSVYQNFITRHILLHPEEDRFYGDELKESLRAVNLKLEAALEHKKIGILGVCVKTG